MKKKNILNKKKTDNSKVKCILVVKKGQLKENWEEEKEEEKNKGRKKE